MNQNHTKTHHERGIALVAVLLVGAVLLGILLATASNVAISARRLTGDQRQTLQARYAAESGLNTLEINWQTRLEILAELLSSKQLQIPNATYNDPGAFQTYIAAFCGTGPISAQPDNAGYICRSQNAPNAARVFRDFIADASPVYANRNITPEAFWDGFFSQVNTTQDLGNNLRYSAIAGFAPIGVKQTSEQKYVFEFGVENTDVIGQKTSGNRVIAEQRLEREYNYRAFAVIGRENLIPGTAYNDQGDAVLSGEFDGPIHTNDTFRFYGNPVFSSSVTSSNCPGGNVQGCNPTPANAKVIVLNSAKTPITVNDPAQLEAMRTNDGNGTNGTKPFFSQPDNVDFAAPTLRLPTNTENQQSAAQSEGIAIVTNGDYNTPGSVVSANIELVSTTGGNSMTWLDADNWDASQERWKSDDVDYQQIRVIKQVMTEVPKECDNAGNPVPQPPSPPPGPTPPPSPPNPPNIIIRAPQPAPRQVVVLAQTRNCGTELKPIAVVTTYRVDKNGRIQQQASNGTWQTALNANGQPIGTFNGVIHVNGDVQVVGPQARLSDLRDKNGSLINPEDSRAARPAIAPFSKINITTTGNANLYNDLKYTDPPCASAPGRNATGGISPAACKEGEALQDTKNIFGVYTPTGSINIMKSNKNLAIHAALLASSGTIQVPGYDQGSPMARLDLLGGMVMDRYGNFGVQNTDGQLLTGYSRRLTYDRRFALGAAPPLFPVLATARQAPKAVLCSDERVGDCTQIPSTNVQLKPGATRILGEQNP